MGILEHGRWIEHDPVGAASEAMQRLKEHDRVAEVLLVGDVLNVSKLRPFDGWVVQVDLGRSQFPPPRSMDIP